MELAGLSLCPNQWLPRGDMDQIFPDLPVIQEKRMIQTLTRALLIYKCRQLFQTILKKTMNSSKAGSQGARLEEVLEAGFKVKGR